VTFKVLLAEGKCCSVKRVN